MAAEEISQKLGRPLFKVRSILREMTEAGMIAADGGDYAITEDSKK